MATPVIMPRQGQSVESCIITKWHKNKGDKVEPGDVLFTYETDKATFEEEAKESGILLELFFDEGDDIPVLTNVCVIGKEGEDVSSYRPNADQEDSQAETGSKEESTTDQPMEESLEVLVPRSQVTAEDGRIKISPRARNLADKAGVDYRQANPTGPEGRIIERDISELIANGPVATRAAMGKYIQMNGKEIPGTGLGGRITTRDIEMPAGTPASSIPDARSQKQDSPYEDVKITNIRKVIAKSMHESLANMAQLTLNSSFDATEILEFKKELN